MRDTGFPARPDRRCSRGRASSSYPRPWSADARVLRAGARARRRARSSSGSRPRSSEHGDHDHRDRQPRTPTASDTSGPVRRRRAPASRMPPRRPRRCRPGFQDLIAIGNLSEPTGGGVRPGRRPRSSRSRPASSSPSTTTRRPASSSRRHHVNFANLDVQVQQLLGPRADRHRGRPAVRHGRPQLRLRQLRLQPGPPRHPGDRARSGATPGQQYDECPQPGLDGAAGGHRMPDQHPGLPTPA